MNSLQVIFPMAGRGRRFIEAGFQVPKPLIEVAGTKPMIQVAIENLGLRARYWYLCLGEHLRQYSLTSILRLVTNPLGTCEVVGIPNVTGGQADSVKAMLEVMRNHNRPHPPDFSSPVIVANCDQFLDGWHPSAFMDFIRRDDPDGAILTFSGSDPKWSFAAVEPEGNRVVYVEEKKPISTRACCGVFYFKTLEILEATLRDMMADDANRVGGEWYLAPAYNFMIRKGLRVIEYPVPQMLGLGTPEDLSRFERLVKAGKISIGV